MATINATSTSCNSSCIGTTTTASIPNSSYIDTITTTSIPFSQISSWKEVQQIMSVKTLTGKKSDMIITPKEKNVITKVEILCPNKVLRFTFDDKTIIKTICTEDDEFDFRFAFFIAFAKKLYKNTYTSEGIFQKAKELQYTKEYVKKVDKAIKTFEREQKEKELIKQKEKELKEQKKRRMEKKNIQKAKKKEARIEEIAEAIKRANK